MQHVRTLRRYHSEHHFAPCHFRFRTVSAYCWKASRGTTRTHVSSMCTHSTHPFGLRHWHHGITFHKLHANLQVVLDDTCAGLLHLIACHTNTKMLLDAYCLKHRNMRSSANAPPKIGRRNGSPKPSFMAIPRHMAHRMCDNPGLPNCSCSPALLRFGSCCNLSTRFL